MKSHNVIFDARSIWTQKPRDNAQNLEAQPRGFEHCREVFESIYFKHQKLHRAISCLYFDRGLFEVLSRHSGLLKMILDFQNHL